MAMTKIKGLQMWCRKMTDGYPHVDVANFTTAWRDGMAFCAIIHRFRPDLIDYDSLSPDNVYENCKLAFEVAEKELDIPAFLEADDMARLKVPDKLSVITYVSQYYNFLHALPQLGGPGVKGKGSNKSTTPTTAASKRPSTTDTTSQGPSTKKAATKKDGKENISNNMEKVGDKCNICHERVYLLERHMEEGKLYHRSCYRHSELSPTNKVYTRSPFLSPSLSSETPPRPVSPSPHSQQHHSATTDSRHHRTPGSHHPYQAGMGGTPQHSSVSSTKQGVPVSPSGSQNVGMRQNIKAGDSEISTINNNLGAKHTLAGFDRDDKKKSKLQDQQGDNKQAKAQAIKDRLQNIKDKYETPKDSANDISSTPKKSILKTSALKEKQSHTNAFPLSRKEAKQLERHREEKHIEKLSSVGGKRNIPLIFQQNQDDKTPQSSSASNVLSSEYAHLPANPSILQSSTFSSNSTMTVTPTTNKTTVSSQSPKKELPSVKSEAETSRPVAKTRTHKPDLSQSDTPKAAPRRNLITRDTTGQVKSSPRDTSQPQSARSSGSDTPPPLPSSPPPPLPNSPIPSVPSQATTTSSARLQLGEEHKKSKVSTHGPVKSQVAGNSATTAVVKAGPPHQSKRWSSPHIHNAPMSVFVAPQAGQDPEEKQLISGLLVSLAGVRGRASSVSGPAEGTDQPTAQITLQPSNTKIIDKDISNRVHNTKITVSKTPKNSEDVTSSKSSHKRAENGLTSEKVPEALSVLNTLKKVDSNPNSAKSLTIVNKIDVILETKPQKSSSQVKEPSNVVLGKPTHSETETVAPSSAKTSSVFTDIKLKHVSSDPPHNGKHVSTDSSHSGKALSTPAFDVHLKKINHKPGDFTQASVESSKGDTDKHKTTYATKGPSDKTAQPSVVQAEVRPSQSHKASVYGEEELPDWKLALEKRKQKLQQDVAKSRSTANVKAIKANLVSFDTKSSSADNKLAGSADQVKTEKNNLVGKPASDSPRNAKPSNANSNSHSAVEKVRATASSSEAVKQKGKESPRDWIHAAEMKIAALGGFDSDEESKARNVSPREPATAKLKQQKMTNTDANKSLNKHTDKTKVNNSDKAKEESKPEFLSGLSKLKHVDVSHKSDQSKGVKSTESKDQPDTRGKHEDFREKLHKLKHVEGSGEGHVVSDKEETKRHVAESEEKHKKHLTKPLPVIQMNNGMEISQKNKNRNCNTENMFGKYSDNINGYISPQPAQTNKLLDSVNLNSSPEVSDNELNKDNKKHSKQKTSTPITENGKGKKKIKLFGKNKKDKTASPTESPINTKKKIAVTAHFDFDKSSDLESSLIDGTSQLSLGQELSPPITPSSNKKLPQSGHISAIELQQQLLDIDSRLTDLELRGRDLEDSIRNGKIRRAKGRAIRELLNVLEEEDDSLMIKWFELVSEKNDLVRQEADLVYMSREQDLESEQDHIESQLRYLISKPDGNKSGAEIEEEEYLIQRKIELVEQRNRIVDSMDEDRLRYEEEDRDIEFTLRDKGLWKDSNGTLKALKGKKVSNSTFFT